MKKVAVKKVKSDWFRKATEDGARELSALKRRLEAKWKAEDCKLKINYQKIKESGK